MHASSRRWHGLWVNSELQKWNNNAESKGWNDGDWSACTERYCTFFTVFSWCVDSTVLMQMQKVTFCTLRVILINNLFYSLLLQILLINVWDTWMKLVPIGNTEAHNGYYVTNDATFMWRSLCLHTFGIFLEGKMS